MKKFEYMTCYVGGKGHAFKYSIVNGINEFQLNELGKEGWELVNFALITTDDDHESTAVFKREYKEK